MNQSKEVRQQNTTKMKNCYEHSIFVMQDRLQEMKDQMLTTNKPNSSKKLNFLSFEEHKSTSRPSSRGSVTPRVASTTPNAEANIISDEETKAFLKPIDENDSAQNIKVALRIRKMNESEKMDSAHCTRSYELFFGKGRKPVAITVGKDAEARSFRFPIILPETADQEDAFQPARELIDRALQGGNCSIFAYG